MNNNIIINDNGNNIFRYDLGPAYYEGPISIDMFPIELQSKYIDIINEAILYLDIDSNKEPKIISKFEFNTSSPTNNFLICFELKNVFINICKIIKIPITRYNKTIEQFFIDESSKIKLLENTNIIYKDKINELESKISNLENKINILETKLISSNPIKVNPDPFKFNPDPFKFNQTKPVSEPFKINLEQQNTNPEQKINSDPPKINLEPFKINFQQNNSNQTKNIFDPAQKLFNQELLKQT